MILYDAFSTKTFLFNYLFLNYMTKKPEPGDLIKVITKKETLEGVLIPSPDLSQKQTLILKLKNGYNIGISKKNIKKIQIIKKYKKSKDRKKKVIKKNKKLPTISILHTGGTIASKVDYHTGGVVSKFTPEELISMFPELKEIANIKSRLMKNMWSQDMRFCHYNLIAKEIKKEIENGSEGVIVTQGTDTLHYTSAALSFILEDLAKPVLIVGSQRSSDRGSSDAYLNLINAAYFIANSNFAEVSVCMHENMDDNYCHILQGTKCRKLHSSRRDAFQPVNSKAFARVNYIKKDIQFIRKDYNLKSNKKLKLKLFNEKIKVGIIKQHTNMYAEQFLFYKNYDGLVIETTGLGCLPISKIDESNEESGCIQDAIKKIINNGVIVVNAPQTIFGRINMNVYEDQRRAQQIGVLGNMNDMTPATTFIKLAWLLSNYQKEKVKELITKNLRGEISERLTPKEFLKNFN
jgi:glutamyl-tRNA(Gln) amidotransferase subunit D